MTLWTIVWIVIAFFAVIFTLRRRTALYLAREAWAPGVLKLSGSTVEVSFEEPLMTSKPYVYVMNHQSVMDIPSAFATLPSDLHFVAKNSLKYVPFLGWYMWMTGMFFVHRGSRAKSIASLGEAAKRIAQGASVLIYAEGTRSRTGEVQPFKRGAFAMAIEAQVPIVPVAVEGSRHVIAAGAWTAHPSHIRIRVGRPILTEGLPKEHRGTLSTEVEARVRALKEQLNQDRAA